MLGLKHLPFGQKMQFSVKKGSSTREERALLCLKKDRKVQKSRLGEEEEERINNVFFRGKMIVIQCQFSIANENNAF